jgi:ergothioneine biosynthesis protein EgtB
MQSSAPALRARYERVRAQTAALAAPLSEADAQVQSMPDASPTKWHLAHTTWFFETFVLERFEPGFAPHHPAFRVLFNSYYQGVGEQHPRPQRGLVTRPGLAEVLAYRHAVDERMAGVLSREPGDDALALVELGLQHEQQHQELILTDLKHLFGCNPLDPVYRPAAALPQGSSSALGWCDFEGGRVSIGHGGHGFAFDNEGPRHDVLLRPYALADRLVTQGEWLAFIDAGGYTDSRWWLASGWDWRRAQGIEAPLYWRRDGARWSVFTLHGRVALDADAPAVHMSYYEADAYARWRAAHDGLPCRLPTEAEWEHAAQAHEAEAVAQGHFVESGVLQPQAASPSSTQASRPRQLFGDAWEWTASAYLPYPGYRPWAGAVGEYNGKFMINQMVLRGGSCATPRDHIRASYRNFFPTDARWQFSGMRLARDLD